MIEKYSQACIFNLFVSDIGLKGGPLNIRVNLLEILSDPTST